MALRRDFCDGRWDTLEKNSAHYLELYSQHLERYRGMAAFSPIGKQFFERFCVPVYADAARIARDASLLVPPIPAWRWQLDREKKGEQEGWTAANFDDRTWRTTDPRSETWSDLGLFSYYGAMWYRTAVRLSEDRNDKPTFLWIGGVDDTCRVYVNGQAVTVTNLKNESAPELTDYGRPLRCDISSAIKPGENQITVRATRSTLNEVGTGGLLGPVVIYREK
jgi:hypothetical protein